MDISDSNNHPNDEILENSQNGAEDVEDDWEKLEIPVEKSDDTDVAVS